MIKWSLEKRKLKVLINYNSNPHYNLEKDDEKLDYSFKEIGFCSAIVINTKNVILSGNMRYKILLKRYGEEYEIDCYVPDRDLTEEEEKKVVLLLNQASSSCQINQQILNNYFNNIDIDYDLLDIKLDLDVDTRGLMEEQEQVVIQEKKTTNQEYDDLPEEKRKMLDKLALNAFCEFSKLSTTLFQNTNYYSWF